MSEELLKLEIAELKKRLSNVEKELDSNSRALSSRVSQLERCPQGITRILSEEAELKYPDLIINFDNKSGEVYRD